VESRSSGSLRRASTGNFCGPTKLVEEAGEVATADDAHAPEELADVLEVVLALAADLGLDAGGLEKLRAAKAADRGSFTERIVWCGSLSS
jgi:predicted house-cleaning noncanonical NTP pyrophosphatase (MazG superfamily)